MDDITKKKMWDYAYKTNRATEGGYYIRVLLRALSKAQKENAELRARLEAQGQQPGRHADDEIELADELVEPIANAIKKAMAEFDDPDEPVAGTA